MFYIVYGLLYVVSLLPLRVLFLLSDFANFIIYHVIGYRRKVVMDNLSIAFPGKSEEEKTRIAKKFYLNFTDNFIETIKLISAGTGYINKHFTGDYSLFDQVYQQGRKSQIHLGHIFNWEMANLAVAANIRQKLLTVYMPVDNKLFDKVFLKLRGKTNAALLPATDIRRALMPWRHEAYTIALVADQNPAWPSNAYWLEFFGRPTPFLEAPENGARIGNLPVIFCHFTKVKRGYYKAWFIMGEENPASLPKGELTKKYVQFLEEVIKQNPDTWLWSHRRWKWQWKEEYGPVIS